MARRRRQRDYKQEYRDRVARGLARGLSRSAARGHPRPASGARPADVGAAELRLLREAAARASPGGWVEIDGILTRGPPASADGGRRAAADRVAQLAGAPSPVGMSRAWRVGSVYGARAFVEEFIRLGLGSEQQAYTLWFSP